MSYALDASTILAFLFKERGAETAANAIEDGALVSSVNLSEVVAKMIDSGASDESIRDRIAFLNLEVRDFSQEDAFTAGLLRRQTRVHGLSFGDRACLALAQSLDLPVLTADWSWRAVELPGLQVHVIR